MKDAGRIAAAIDRAPEAPHRVTKLQAMRRMQDMGIWAAFGNWRAANVDAAEEWTAAHMIHRNDPWTRQVAADLGMTEADIDTFFREAAKL